MKNSGLQLVRSYPEKPASATGALAECTLYKADEITDKGGDLLQTVFCAVAELYEKMMEKDI